MFFMSQGGNLTSSVGMTNEINTKGDRVDKELQYE
jgi:hypothetical protein